MDVRWAHRPVVAGVDGSDAALRAVGWAAREAVRRRTGLRLVAAFTVPPEQVVGRAGWSERFADELMAAEHELLAEAAAAAQRAATGVEVTREVRTGHPVGVLVEESRAAQLVVVGNRGRSGVAGLLLGSVSVALAARAECPLVVVRGEPSHGPVVVGVDGSPVSEAATAFAFEAAAALRVPLVAVHAWGEPAADAVWEPLPDHRARREGEREVLAERLAGWADKYPDVVVERVVVLDRPAHALLERARGAQMVVVGSHGRGSASGLLLGSVGHAVLHAAACPVAVVRGTGRRTP